MQYLRGSQLRRHQTQGGVSSSRAEPFFKPAPCEAAGVKNLNVLYLFAGVRHRADVNACLNSIISEFNACIDFDFTVAFTLRQIDLSETGPISGELGRLTHSSVCKEILGGEVSRCYRCPSISIFLQGAVFGQARPKTTAKRLLAERTSTFEASCTSQGSF